MLCRVSVVVHLSVVCAFVVAAESSEAGTLIGEWEFNEGGGAIAYDTSGFGHDATIYSDGVWPSWEPGYVSFDAGTAPTHRAHIDVTTLPSFNTLGSFSVAARFRITNPNLLDAATVACKFGNGNYQDDEWSFGCYLDRVPNFSVFSNEGDVSTAGDEPVSLNDWHTVVGVFESGVGTRLYVDGDLVGETPSAILACRNTNEEVMFGNCNFYGGSNWDGFFGDLDYVRIYQGVVVPEPCSWTLLSVAMLTFGISIIIRKYRAT